MKTCSLPLLAAWCLALCIALAANGSAQPPPAPDDFKILGVRVISSFDLIKVDNAWLKLPRRIQATLHVGADTPASAIFVKAYFYDRNSQLVASFARPNNIWTSTGRGLEEVGLPKTLLRTKNSDVYFAIPDDLQAKNWTTVLVVFGNETKVAASANPASAVSKLDFPEKAHLAGPTP